MARSTSSIAVVGFMLVAHVLRSAGQTPSPLWQMPGDGRGVPAAAGRTVYSLTNSHEVVALNLETGALRWKQSLGQTADRTAGSAVVLVDDIVVVGDYDVFGLDRTTGSVRWRFVPSTGYGPGIYLGGSTKGRVFAGSPAGRMYAIDASTGKERWSALVSADDKTTVFPPVTDGRFTIATYTTFAAPNTGGVVAFDSANGRERWRIAFPRSSGSGMGSGAAGGPVVTDQSVFAASGDGVIHVLDRTTGAFRWSLPGVRDGTSEIGKGGDYRALTLTGRLLVAGSLGGTIVAYDIDTRRERWRRIPRPAASPGFALASDAGSVYVPFVDGTLVVLNRSDGTVRWRAGDWRNGFYWPPAIAGERVFVTSATGGFVAFSR